jgi:hypothetical protein
MRILKSYLSQSGAPVLLRAANSLSPAARPLGIGVIGPALRERKFSRRASTA